MICYTSEQKGSGLNNIPETKNLNHQPDTLLCSSETMDQNKHINNLITKDDHCITALKKTKYDNGHYFIKKKNRHDDDDDDDDDNTNSSNGFCQYYCGTVGRFFSFLTKNRKAIKKIPSRPPLPTSSRAEQADSSNISTHRMDAITKNTCSELSSASDKEPIVVNGTKIRLELPIPIRRTIEEGPRGPKTRLFEMKQIQPNAGLTPVLCQMSFEQQQLPRKTFYSTHEIPQKRTASSESPGKQENHRTLVLFSPLKEQQISPWFARSVKKDEAYLLRNKALNSLEVSSSSSSSRTLLSPKTSSSCLLLSKQPTSYKPISISSCNPKTHS